MLVDQRMHIIYSAFICVFFMFLYLYLYRLFCIFAFIFVFLMCLLADRRMHTLPRAMPATESGINVCQSLPWPGYLFHIHIWGKHPLTWNRTKTKYNKHNINNSILFIRAFYFVQVQGKASEDVKIQGHRHQGPRNPRQQIQLRTWSHRNSCHDHGGRRCKGPPDVHN